MKKCDWSNGCSSPGEYSGVMYKVGSDLRRKKITRPMCTEHYMLNTFGLWPFVCTKACEKNQRKATGLMLLPDDQVVWLSMCSVIRAKYRGHALGTLKPKCPWCGKNMKVKPVKEKSK